MVIVAPSSKCCVRRCCGRLNPSGVGWSSKRWSRRVCGRSSPASGGASSRKKPNTCEYSISSSIRRPAQSAATHSNTAFRAPSYVGLSQPQHLRIQRYELHHTSPSPGSVSRSAFEYSVSSSIPRRAQSAARHTGLGRPQSLRIQRFELHPTSGSVCRNTFEYSISSSTPRRVQSAATPANTAFRASPHAGLSLPQPLRIQHFELHPTCSTTPHPPRAQSAATPSETAFRTPSHFGLSSPQDIRIKHFELLPTGSVCHNAFEYSVSSSPPRRVQSAATPANTSFRAPPHAGLSLLQHLRIQRFELHPTSGSVPPLCHTLTTYLSSHSGSPAPPHHHRCWLLVTHVRITRFAPSIPWTSTIPEFLGEASRNSTTSDVLYEKHLRLFRALVTSEVYPHQFATHPDALCSGCIYPAAQTAATCHAIDGGSHICIEVLLYVPGYRYQAIFGRFSSCCNFLFR